MVLHDCVLVHVIVVAHLYARSRMRNDAGACSSSLADDHGTSIVVQKCFSCGKMGHRKIDCPHKQRRTERLCYGCNQPGHERSNCPNQGQAQHQQRPRFGRGVPSPRRMGRGRQAFG